MPVSLVKIPVVASNSRGAIVRLGGIPVHVIRVQSLGTGRVIVVGLTLNGAEVSRVLAAGAPLAPVPAWTIRHASTGR